MYVRSQANSDFREEAGEARAVLDQRDQRARGEIDALQDALPIELDLAREPIARRVVGDELFVRDRPSPRRPAT